MAAFSGYEYAGLPDIEVYPIQTNSPVRPFRSMDCYKKERRMKMEYQIEIREIEPVRVAYIKFKGFAPEANKVFPNVFKSIRGQSNGAPFFCYLSMNPETKMGDMELCVPTEATPAGNGIEVKEIPRIKAVCNTYWFL